MSTLPTHKKTPEELARLRDTLGVPGHAPTTQPAPLETPPVPAPEPGTAAVPHPPSPAHSPPAPHEPKPVRSLKRSEREPAAAPRHATAPAISKLPDHRHTPEELATIRRQGAISAIKEGGFEPPASATKLVLALAYVLALGGAAFPTLLRWVANLSESYKLGMAMSGGYHLLVAGSLASLPVAGFIALKRTQSRHHAAFVAIIAFFALIFALLHYFPQLRHGT